jgi:cobalt-zinc-cadmium efflux system outer membrane protein
MVPRAVPRWPLALGLLVAAGCLYPVPARIDQDVCKLAQGPIDPEPPGPSPAPSAPMPATVAAEGTTVQQAEYQKPAGTPSRPLEKGPPTIVEPRETPGLRAPRIFAEEAGRNIPEVPAGLLPTGQPPVLKLIPAPKTPDERAKNAEALRKEFRPLPPLGLDPSPVPGPEGRPLTLSDLQHLALTTSPQVKQAQAAVEAARGAAFQAGLWPNPNVGFEVDTFGTTGGAGYAGAFVDQLIKTAGKLQLARAVATLDLRNAELALKRAQTDLITRVRTGYFQVLVARENIRISKTLAEFADKVYMVQLEQLRLGGIPAGYEPMYLRALALQTRGNLVQARNAYVSTWKQLAAAMGVVAMPLTELAGRVDMPAPVYDFDTVLRRVLAQHTDVLTAENSFQQARLNLQVARVQPVPDVDVRVLVQRDYTGPPFEVAPSVAVSMPMPVWNRNQGGIRQAQANVVQQSEEPHRVRSALTTTLTQAFERYQNNRVLLTYYRDMILPDLVRVYNGVYVRYVRQGEAAGGPSLSDVVVAQGNLAAAVATYIITLGAMWQAVIDVTDLLQTPDLFQINGVAAESPGCVPDLDQLAPLPCRHPCSPAPGLYQAPPAAPWPQTAPNFATPRMPAADEARRRLQPAPLDNNPVTPVSLPAPPEPPTDTR